MDDDSSDILGGRLSVSPPRSSTTSFNIGSSGQILWVFSAILVVLVFRLFAWPGIRRWRENAYRKALRRRHGIPDNDNRPFNVAFAAANRARQERAEKREAQLQGQNDVQQLPPPPPTGRPYAPQPDSSSLRHRLHHATDTRNIYNPFGIGSPARNTGAGNGYGHQYDGTPVPAPGAFMNPPMIVAPTPPAYQPASPPAQPSRPDAVIASSSAPPTHGKHARDEELQVMSEKKLKKSRVGADTAVDGDAVPVWREYEDGMDVDVDEDVQPKRGSKRVASPEDDESIESTRVKARDKRARKVLRDKAPEQLDVDVADEDVDAVESAGMDESVHRGKKRDRAEAGSTFGGDESILDFDEIEDEGKSHRRRKRRTVSQKKPDATARGQKRGREVESVDSDGEDSERPKRESTRKKRGKKGSEAGDLFLEPSVSLDPLCKGRHIGEEWEANGVHYKVGPNGQRLRQELVKKSRSRFPMPSDSRHPDRRANIDVYVETWLSDEEYKAARERHELAWQDSPQESPEPPTPGDVPDIPSKVGKNLLWSSTMSPKDSPAPTRGPFRTSIATNVGLRINPFQQSQAAPGRRISSIYHSTLPAPPDSPTLRTSRYYSKWEKQDLEATAMAKIREKAQQEAAKAAEAKKAVATPAPAPAAIPASTTPAPSITFATPTEKPAQTSDGKSAGTFFFDAPSTTGSSATTIPTLNVPKASTPAPFTTTPATSEAPKPPPMFSFPSAPAANTFSAQTKPGVSNAFSFSPAPVPGASVAPGMQQSAQSLGAGTAPSGSFFSPASFGPQPSHSNAALVRSSSTPGIGIFSAAGNTPSLQSTPQSNAPPKSTFTFSAPSSSAQPSAPATSAFGVAQPEQKKPEQTQSSSGAPGGSLLPRLGMNAPSTGASQPSSAAAGSSAQSAGTSPFSFGFGKPSTPAPTSAADNKTGDAQKAAPFSNATMSAGGASTSAPAVPKFNFGFSAKPSTSSAPASGSASTAATSSEAPKPAASTFNFAAPNAPTSSAPTSTAQPVFGFGASSQPAPSNSNPFGAGATTSTPAKPAFGFGTGGSTASAFSTTPAGTPNTSAGFGPAANNAFARPADGPKPVFVSGNTGFGSTTSSAPPAFGNTGTASAPAAQAGAPKFSFGAPSSVAPSTSSAGIAGGETQNKPAFSFNFGGPSSSGTNTSTATNTSASPFGAPSNTNSNTPSPFGNPSQTTPNAFGFGNPSSNSSSTGAFSFGSSNTNQNQKQ
ncbi:hypothetical protein AcW2_006600 [Taiwanofungus camphoratus]|nr:hypothetical protein AcW2_006600 [Antrodia cinnamomea]